MKMLARWGKFSLVGAMGMAVQLSTLALFDRCAGSHYLWASAAALEITLLHNFTWHWHFTWRDRRDASTGIQRFVRFHLCNGVISMAGNLAFMALLVRGAGLPLLVSNVVAIICCSVVNFWLGNRWVFSNDLPYTEI